MCRNIREKLKKTNKKVDGEGESEKVGEREKAK